VTGERKRRCGVLMLTRGVLLVRGARVVWAVSEGPFQAHSKTAENEAEWA